MGGNFVTATVESVTAAAAEAVKKMPADFRVSITNAPGDHVYPISSFTWLLLYENPKDKAQAKVMSDFVKWALTDGQKFAPELGYAPLPDAVVKLELAALAHIKDFLVRSKDLGVLGWGRARSRSSSSSLSWRLAWSLHASR